MKPPFYTLAAVGVVGLLLGPHDRPREIYGATGVRS